MPSKETKFEKQLDDVNFSTSKKKERKKDRKKKTEREKERGRENKERKSCSGILNVQCFPLQKSIYHNLN